MADTINPEDFSHDELKAKADEVGVTKNGSSEAIAERINDKLALDESEAIARKAAAERKDLAEQAESDRVKQLIADAAVEKEQQLDAAATQEGSKAAETDGKEASVPASDPRDSVFDLAPGKSLDAVAQRVVEHARGEHQGDPFESLGTWFYVAQEDDYTLIDVAAKVGLQDHSQLTAINGVFNGILNVQPGQRVLLPAGYTFVDVPHCARFGYEEGSVVETEPAE